MMLTLSQIIATGNTDTIVGLIIIASMMIVVVIGVLVYNWVKESKQGYTLEQQIEDALLPYLHGIIVAAFEESLIEIDEIETTIENIDKEELAKRIYNLLPEEISGYDTRLIQSILTIERFTDIFLYLYNELKIHYVEQKGNFIRLFEEWETGN